MIKARPATVADTDELVRLRAVMLGALDGTEVAPGRWQDSAAATLRARLVGPDGSMMAFVVERPDEPGRLAACAIGVIDSRLAGPNNPDGQVGHVFNVVTDPDYRRRGYSRACLVALLDWYRRRGITKIGLNASAAGAPLYRSLGFASTAAPSMRLTATTA